MAKLSYTKLGLKVNQENGVIFHNDQRIEVKSYLPVNDKLKLISNVINLSADDNNFSNPVKEDVYFALEIIENYTNISFTDKQKEDLTKLYDSFVNYFETMLQFMAEDAVIAKIKRAANLYHNILNINIKEEGLKKHLIQINSHYL